MLNHKRPNESMWTFEDHKGAFTITTTKRILKGGQIFDSYGRKCNSRYFVNYGFALDENEDNQVNLMFQLFPEDEDSLYHQKLALVRGRARRFFQIPFDHLERVQHQCFSYLRIKHADAKELTEIQGNEDNQPQRLNVQFVSPNNEVNVLADIAFAAECVLAGFDTSLEEDDRLLVEEDKSLTMNVRNCIIMRRGEKQICHAYINLYRIMREYDEKSNCGDSWSTCTYKQFRKSVNDHIKGKGKEPSVAWRVEKYVREVWQPHFTGEKLEINISSNAHEGD
jgi:histone-lysine N-methyltransferase SETD3